MFLIKIFHFLFGYVILSLKGSDREKNIGILAKKGINLTNVVHNEKEISAEIPYIDADKISGIDGCSIKKEYGLPPLLKKLKKRPFFLIGFFTVALLLAVASQFVWTVDFVGAEKCDIAALKKATEMAGVKVGVLKCRLPKPLDMKNIILDNTDDICWCFVYVKGTNATVKVHQSVVPKTLAPPDAPCDIIAMRNGIIKAVTAQRGIITVCENQAVTAGDTVISGTYVFEEVPGYQVHSAGSVKAQTEHKRSAVFRQFYCYKTYSGRKRRFVTLDFYKWRIPLYIKKRVVFENYDENTKCIGNNFGLGLEIREASEYTEIKEPIPYDTAVELGKNKLEKEIAKELLSPAELIDKTVNAEKIDEETVLVTVTMDFIEEIGTEKQIEEMNFIEPKINKLAGGD